MAIISSLSPLWCIFIQFIFHKALITEPKNMLAEWSFAISDTIEVKNEQFDMRTYVGHVTTRLFIHLFIYFALENENPHHTLESNAFDFKLRKHSTEFVSFQTLDLGLGARVLTGFRSKISFFLAWYDLLNMQPKWHAIRRLRRPERRGETK